MILSIIDENMIKDVLGFLFALFVVVGVFSVSYKIEELGEDN